jgi:L-rhamnose mutarotase
LHKAGLLIYSFRDNDLAIAHCSLAARAQREDSREVEEMKRFGMVIKLKPGSADAYRGYHSAVWPEVIDKIQECNIRNYSIYFKDDILFSYFEYHGADLKADWDKMAAHPKTQEWWGVIKPLQDPLTTRKDGEWWATMEEIFHLD